MATLAIHPGERLAAVVFSNSTQVGVNELALHAVMPQDWTLTVFEAFEERAEVELSQTIIERYVGDYAISPGNAVAITMDGESLYWQIGSSPNFELAAESDSVFFDKANPSVLTIEFIADDNGEVTALRYNYNGAEGTAGRLGVSSEDIPPFPIRAIRGFRVHPCH